MSNLVIIPTFKEKENIESLIRTVFSLSVPFDILIIDDNSPDGTASIVKSLQSEFRDLHIIERPGKLGLGTAYITGFNWALDNNYDYIFAAVKMGDNDKEIPVNNWVGLRKYGFIWNRIFKYKIC